MNKPLFTMSALELETLLEAAIRTYLDDADVPAELHITALIEQAARDIVVKALWSGTRSF